MSVLDILDPMSVDGWRHMDGWGWAFGGFWLLLLLVAAVVVLVVLLATSSGRSGGRSSGGRAREILDERYARGEISTEEYQERRRQLD